MAGRIANLLGRIRAPAISRRSSLLGLYTFALFLIFLLITFPHHLVAQRAVRQIERDTGWQVRFQSVQLLPWAGYRFSNLRVLPNRANTPELLTASIVDIRPTLKSLLSGSIASLVFSGDLYRGEVEGQLIDGDTRNLAIEWSNIELSDVPSLQQIAQGTWQGRLSGNVDAAIGKQVSDIDGEGRVKIRNASLSGAKARGFTIPSLSRIGGDAKFSLKGGRLEIQSLKLTSEQVEINLRGRVFLRKPFPESRLSATVMATAMPGNVGIDGLLRIASGGKSPIGGAYKFTVSGVIGRPQVR